MPGVCFQLMAEGIPSARWSSECSCSKAANTAAYDRQGALGDMRLLRNFAWGFVTSVFKSRDILRV